MAERQKDQQDDITSVPASTSTDSGWAWLILLSSFIIMLLWEGTIKSLAVLLPTLKDNFQTYTWIIGLMIALMNAVKDFSGPLVGVLTDIVDPRHLGLAGGLLSGMGLIGASIATNVWQLTFCVSIMNGLGVGLLMIPSMTLLGKYFDRYYPLASGIAYAGLSLGIVVFAPLTQIFLESYGWRSSLLLLGAICCHNLVAGALFRQFQDTHDSYMPLQQDDIETQTPMAGEGSAFSWISDASQIPSLRSRAVKVFGLPLFDNSSFLAAIFMMSCDSFSNTGWIVYFVPHCLVKGLSLHQATLIATATGLTNLIGRFIYIPFLSITGVHGALYISGILAAVSLAIDVWTNTLSSILVANVLYTLGAGVLKPLSDVYIKSIVGKEYLSQAFGWRMAINGIFRLAAGFGIGWLYDQTGSYAGGFVLLGTVHAVGIVVFAMDNLRKWLIN